MSAIHRVLLKSKLSQYEQKVLEQGADDLDQLREVSDDDFQQLLEAIGMASKPFHVMRFRNAIGRISASTCKSSSHSPLLSNVPAQSTTNVLIPVHPRTKIHASNVLSTCPGAETRTQATQTRAGSRACASTLLTTNPGIKERTHSSTYLSTNAGAEARTHANTHVLNHPGTETPTHATTILSMQPDADNRTHASSLFLGESISTHHLPPLGKTSSSSAHTVTVFATQYTEPCVGNSLANGETTAHTMIEGLATRPEFLVNPTTDAEVMSSSSLHNVQKDCGTENGAPFEDIFPEQLQQLVDSTTPVQLGLAPSPIIPSIWDEPRKRIIREGSQIFKISLEVGSKRHQSELAQHESLINDASYTLCLWDPTLLVRREELFTLAKKLVKLSSTTGEIHEQYSFTSDSVKKSTQPYPLQRGPDGKFQNCFQLNYELRERQIAQLEQLLAENVAEEQVKQVLLSDAKRRKDFSMILQLQESISVLGQSYKDLRYQLSQMKKKQRRGVKFQEKKKAQQASSSHSPKPLVTSFQTSPLLPQLEATTSIVTPSGSTDGSSMQVEHAVTVQSFEGDCAPVQQQQEAVTVTLDEMDTNEQTKTTCDYLQHKDRN